MSCRTPGEPCWKTVWLELHAHAILVKYHSNCQLVNDILASFACKIMVTCTLLKVNTNCEPRTEMVGRLVGIQHCDRSLSNNSLMRQGLRGGLER